MHIIDSPIPIKTIQKAHNHFFEKMVKIVVDVEKQLMAIDAELHADLEQFLLQNGSKQADLWGANVYFSPVGLIELNSLINIRPAQNNPGMDIMDAQLQEKVISIIKKLILF